MNLTAVMTSHVQLLHAFLPAKHVINSNACTPSHRLSLSIQICSMSIIQKPTEDRQIL